MQHRERGARHLTRRKARTARQAAERQYDEIGRLGELALQPFDDALRIAKRDLT